MLGEDLGIYIDFYDCVGYLYLCLLCVVCVVVDIGVYVQGWSKQQVVSYLQKIVDMSSDDVNVEVEWIMVQFGQVLFNVVGLIIIVVLCDKVRVCQGVVFDLCCFYVELLKDGLMLLDVLDCKMECWMVQLVSIMFMFLF